MALKVTKHIFQSADNSSNSPNVLPETKKHYQKVVKSIRKKIISQSCGAFLNEEITPTQLVKYLRNSARSGQIRPKTALTYRAALIYWLKTQPSNREIQAALAKAANCLPKHGYKGHKEGVKVGLYSTRSSRKRTFRNKDLAKLIRWLNKKIKRAKHDKRVSKRSYQLKLWLLAGLGSGLRPVEWNHAKWHDKAHGQLLVRTAKVKLSEKYQGTNRVVRIRGKVFRLVTIEPKYIKFVDLHLKEVRKHSQSIRSFKQYYRRVKDYLYRVNRLVFKDKSKRITLYTMRGQFAANRKAIVGLEKTSQQMGCSPSVASTYYGSISHAHKGYALRAKRSQKNIQKLRKNRMKN